MNIRRFLRRSAVRNATASVIKDASAFLNFLEGGPDIETTILREASEVALREVAKRQGMVSMQEDGILKAISGHDDA